VIEGAPSRTALTAALMRALHTRRDPPPLIHDPWGDRLVSAGETAALARRALDGAAPGTRLRLETLGSPEAILDRVLRAHPTFGGVILRTRFAEDALERAAARGIRQYVLVGAVFDSFLARQPPFARALELFEIDHPATQAMKRQRLAACAVEIPSNVHFVAADLSREPLAAVLQRCGFSGSVPAFFSWLGVTVYLSRDANLSTLRGIATVSAPGSEVVFTYIDQRALEGHGSSELEKIRTRLAARGEPWISGFDPVTLARELAALGLDRVEDLGSRELSRRYCAARTDGLSPGPSGHIARARVLA